MVKSELQKLGFTPQEASVYTALLSLNGAVVSEIAKKAGSHRVTTYNILENLENKQYIRKIKHGGKLFYEPVDPVQLLKRAERSYRVAKGIVPELSKLGKNYKFKPNVRLFESKESISDIFKDMLESSGNIVGFVNFREISALYDDIFTDFNTSMLASGKTQRLLCPDDTFNKRYFEENLMDLAQADLLNVFAVNPTQFKFKNAQYIYDNRVSTISFDRNEMMGVIIESANNAETNRAIFDLAWLGATSFVAK